MSTVPIASRSSQSAGHQWFESRLPELSSRCRTFLRRIPYHLREEAQAEILASIFQYVLHTATHPAKMQRHPAPESPETPTFAPDATGGDESSRDATDAIEPPTSQPGEPGAGPPSSGGPTAGG
jgi:hypothetical protein